MQTPLTVLDLPTQKVNAFLRKGIYSVEDLATYSPRKYYDFREVTAIADLEDGQKAVVYGKVIDKEDATGAGNPWSVTIEDKAGTRMRVVWFGSKYFFSRLYEGKKYYFCGKIRDYNLSHQMAHPYYISEGKDILGIQPVYSKIKRVSDDYLKDAISKSVDYVAVSYKMSEKDTFAESLNLPPYIGSLKAIHRPEDPKTLRQAKLRLAFEDVYGFYTGVRGKSSQGEKFTPFTKQEKTRSFIKNLPFELTKGQSEAVEKIITISSKGERVSSIISGDVGCGKTIVAVIACVLAAENGFQSCVAAPTQVLASQHLESFSNYLKDTGLRIAYLSGSTKKKDRQKIISGIGTGEIDVLIGTHAVFGEDISLKNLGLTIIDEEHKFGVNQKEAIDNRLATRCHSISMTATPIPRSIAKVLYGNEGSVIPIRTMPHGRKPVITTWAKSAKRTFNEILSELERGNKAYIVAPFIEDSENDKFANVVSVDKLELAFRKYTAGNPNVRVGRISGDMDQKEIDEIIEGFAGGKYNVLISTTIVEVGVNVPDATIMAIFSAERFGLSSLHQLRGRVGRSDKQSYCILVSKEETDRIKLMEETTDGFSLAEKDMNLRGPGDILGVAQTGENRIVNLILSKPRLAEAVRSHIFGESE